MTTVERTGPNVDQADYWVSRTGQNWVNQQEALDRLFSNITATFLNAAMPQPGERALDLGCGTGETTLEIGKRIAPGGSAMGLDISSILLDRARQRAENTAIANVEFHEADAQIYNFEPNSFDLLASRFGCMFFSDPIAAFANMSYGLRAGGRVCLATWAPLTNNPWFTVSRDAAIAKLGQLPLADPRAPGPFAFADRQYVLGILNDAGFVETNADEVTVDLVAPDAIEDAGRLAVIVGAASRIVAAFNATPEDVQAIAETATAAFSTYQSADGVRVPAMINLFTAQRP
ncbi:MAG: class I SAM-dependent methyltransferase [Hyphomicrobiaceae bacterium]